MAKTMHNPRNALDTAVLDLFRRAPGQAFSSDDVMAVLATPPRARQRVRTVLAALTQSGILRRTRGGGFTAAAVAAAGMVGAISVHPRGFAFVTPDTGGPDVFIPPGAVGGALSGDRVQIEVTDTGNPRGPAGRVLAIEQQRREELVGELRSDDEGFRFRPLRRELPAELPVSAGAVPAAPPAVSGRWVAARLIRSADGNVPVSVEILRDLGDVREVEGCLESVIAEYDLLPPYTPAESRAAWQVEPRPIGREDLQSLMVLTIDPVDAKDFDDAISIQPGSSPGTAWVGIHIADVAAYVVPGSEVDAAAAARGFTAYLPGRTLPMLPGPLAADRCSLIAELPRLAHSVFVEIDRADGRCLRARRCHSLIRVRARLTFDAVAEFLEHGRGIQAAPDVLAGLAELANLAHVMRGRRVREEAFLDLAGDSVRVRCSENPPQILDLVRESASVSHALVEEFMLAANSAVAAELNTRALPGIFRCHAKPTRSDMDTFMAWADAAFGLPVKRLSSRASMNRFLHGLDSPAARLLVTQEFLRSLPRAEYAATVQPHFGLGKECYCHFTSPIRRYPDLVVHQQLWAVDCGDAPRTTEECRAIAIQTTGQEQQVDYAFFAANDRLKLLLLKDRLRADPGLLLEGMVARETADGLTVFLPEFGLLGVLPGTPREGGRTPRKRDGKRGGRGTGKTHKCGDFILAQPRTVDCVRGVLELQPVRVRLPERVFP